MTTETNWKDWYRRLKGANRWAYDRAIQAAEGAAINHNLSHKAAADVERSMVMLACELLCIRPGDGNDPLHK